MATTVEPVEVRAEAPRRWEAARRSVRAGRSVASHPLLLIAVGAVLSGILVPTFTREAQEQREALAIKGDLVSSMSAAASPFLAATLANVVAHNGNVPRSYDLAYQRWVTTSNDVWTKLRTYVHEHEATVRWSSLILRLRDVYYFFRLGPGEGVGTRWDYTNRLERFLQADCAERQSTDQCWTVDFDVIDKWLAAPRRRFDDLVNFNMEELFFAFRSEMVRIQQLTLEATPQL